MATTAYVNRDYILPFLKTGRFVGVVFEKRNGTLRHIVGRTGVRKYVKGGSRRPPNPNLVTLWESNRANRKGEKDKGYRSIRLNSIKEIHTKGVVLKPV